ncbi:MAG: hypothetical protein NT178_02050 [Proteobacteria bacterium]|nr:hypothetical protein [Pseudomonadota bacterium]
MFMRSTGLGRTLLTGKVSNIFATTVVPSTLEEPQEGVTEPVRMMMMMEIVNPVHWTVRAFLDPSDLRKIVKVIVTNPLLILKGIKFFFSKDPDYGELAKVEASAPKADAGKAPKGPASVPGPGAIPKGPGAIPSRA